MYKLKVSYLVECKSIFINHQSIKDDIMSGWSIIIQYKYRENCKEEKAYQNKLLSFANQYPMIWHNIKEKFFPFFLISLTQGKAIHKNGNLCVLETTSSETLFILDEAKIVCNVCYSLPSHFIKIISISIWKLPFYDASVDIIPLLLFFSSSSLCCVLNISFGIFDFFNHSIILS